MVKKLQRVENWKDQVVFDIFNINAKDMSSFLEDANKNNLAGLAEVYAKVLVTAPKEWGDPNDPVGLLENVPYIYFQQLSKMFVDAFEDAKKS